MKRDLLKINDATLFLFKSVYPKSDVIVSEEDTVKSISGGIIFADGFGDITTNSKIVKRTLELYGKHIFNINNSFHRSWKTIQSIDPKLHYLQQILHYTTTYGLESLGIEYDTKNIYIPNEIVEIPENIKPVNFMVIHAISEEEIEKRVTDLLFSGVALSQDQLDNILYLVSVFNFDIDFNSIKNKEARAAIWPKLEDRPYISVDEFLRVLTYATLGSTLLIRSYRNHKNIKFYLSYHRAKQKEIAELLEDYILSFGMENIASQFLRNKMLFLAFKCESTKYLINKIRRQADKYHKAQKAKTLSSEDIQEANVYQLVKYWNYCISKLDPSTDKLYQIRNGLNYLKVSDEDHTLSNEEREEYIKLLEMIKDRLKDELSHLNGKLIYIPDYIDYKAPSSLKRLCQGVPEGSILKFGDVDHYTIGVHWTNIQRGDREERVDLDLHANSLNNQIGWNSNFRNGEVLYSGDMTDAPVYKGGASEALLFKTKDPYIVTLNDYTQYGEVSYKFIFDSNLKNVKDSRDNFGSIFTPNARTLNCKIDKKRGSNTLGLAMNSKFYFISSSIFSGPVTRRSDLLERLVSYYEETQGKELLLEDILVSVGAKVIKDMSLIPEDSELDYDLSLEAITEDTFVQMFTKPENK